MARGDLTDGEWDLIEALLPSERGRKSLSAQNNRRYLNGMLHVWSVGCPWRDMQERYGKWNSVNVRVRRWAERGVWDGLLETPVELGPTGDWQHKIDSTTVRGHSPAAGAKGDPYGGFWSKTRWLYAENPARTHGQGRPLGFVLTGGEASDYGAVPALLNIPPRKPWLFLADKAYDSDIVRQSLLLAAISPDIPPRSNR